MVDYQLPAIIVGCNPAGAKAFCPWPQQIRHRSAGFELKEEGAVARFSGPSTIKRVGGLYRGS